MTTQASVHEGGLVRRRRRFTLADKIVPVFAGLAFVYLMVPVAYTVAFSFNQAGRRNLVWQGFTLDNWKNPCGAPQVCEAFVNSIQVGLIATVVSTGAALFLSRALTAVGGLAQLLAFLGRRSLEIFLAHIIATAGTRIVLVQLGVNSPALHLFMGTVVGVMAPLVLWWVTDRAGLGRWLFSTPGVATVPVDSSGGSRAATLR